MLENEMKKISTKNLTLIGLFTALIVIGALIRIPVPVVPFTLQFLFTTLAGLLLGGKNGAISVGVYIILGLLGLPVFASGGGISYVLNPTFGYLIGFCAGTYLTGRIANANPRPSFKRLLAACFSGLLVVYLFGLFYYYIISDLYLGNPIGLWPLFLYGFILAVPGDIVLCIFSAVLGKRLIPLIQRIGCDVYV